MTEAEQLFAQYTAHFQAGRLAEAAATLERALLLAPKFSKAWYHLAGTCQRSGDFQKGINACDQANNLEPQNIDYWMLAANLRQDAGDLEDALACVDKALGIRKNYAQGHNNRGIILSDLTRLEEARKAFENAVRLDNNYARAYNNLGSLLIRLQQYKDALMPLQRSVKLNPAYAQGYSNLGTANYKLGKLRDAETSLREALRLNPKLHGAYFYLASVHRDERNLEKAEAVMRDAVRHKPDGVRELCDLGDILSAKGAVDEAAQCFQRAVTLQPSSLVANMRKALLLPTHYDDAAQVSKSRATYTQALAQLSTSVADFADNSFDDVINDSQANNFYLAYQGQNDLPLQTQYADFVRGVLEPRLPELYAPIPKTSTASRRIRLGFASSLLYSCTVGQYFKSWILDIDRNRFEVFVYHNANRNDDLTKRIIAASDHFDDSNPALPVLAKQIRDDHLDVLIYPELGMSPTLFTMASMRLAPVQCCGWGHPVTTGHRNMDYYLSCELMEPEHAQQHYREQLVLLPGMGTRYEVPAQPVKVATRQRSDYQLPENKTLYLYPQSMFKIHPDNDRLLVDVLARNPDSVLVMFVGSHPDVTQKFVDRLSTLFVEGGINTAGRVKILPNMPHDDYKRVNQLCDLMLDTLYWSGGNTSLDALSAGLPVVTLPGEFMRGRQSMGMLTALGVPELIARDHQHYIEIANKVGTDAAYRQQLSERIIANRLNLFEDTRPTAALQEFIQRVVVS